MTNLIGPAVQLLQATGLYNVLLTYVVALLGLSLFAIGVGLWRR